MRPNGLSKNLPGLRTLERLIMEREEEILNDPLEGEVSDEEVEITEPAIDDQNEEDQPLEDQKREGFETDSSDDNASVISEDSEDEKSDSPSLEKAQELKTQGDKHVHSGNWKDAISCYSKALEHSQLAALYGNRSLCYMKTEEFEKAERDCSCAIELDPAYKRMFRRRAAIRLRRRDYYGSAMDLQDLWILSAGSSIDPNIIEEYKIILPLARYVAVNGKCSTDEKFKKLEEDVVEKLSSKEEAAAMSFMSQKMWAQAVESLSMAIMVSPRVPRLYSHRALANLQLGKTKMAEKDCTDAIDLDSTNPHYFKLRAQIRKKIGDVKGSEADEKMAQTLPPIPLTKSELTPTKTASPSLKPDLQTTKTPTRPPPPAAPQTSPLIRIPVKDVYSSSIDELYDLSKLPDGIKTLFGLS